MGLDFGDGDKSLPPGDFSVIVHGKSVAYAVGNNALGIDGENEPAAIERWVKAIALLADARVDWHYSSGYVDIVCLGDALTISRVVQLIQELKTRFPGQIFRIGHDLESGL